MLKKRLAAVILIGFIIVAFYTSAYTIIHAGHDCAGEVCTLCPIILEKRLTGQLDGAFAVGFVLFLAFCVSKLYIQDKKRVNLVNSKIRMNN